MSKSGSKIREQVAHFLVDIHNLELENPKVSKSDATESEV